MGILSDYSKRSHPCLTTICHLQNPREFPGSPLWMGWIKRTTLQPVLLNLKWTCQEPLCSWNWRLMTLSCTKCWGKGVLARYALKDSRLKPLVGDAKFLGLEGVHACQESTPNVLGTNREHPALTGKLSDSVLIAASVFWLFGPNAICFKSTYITCSWVWYLWAPKNLGSGHVHAGSVVVVFIAYSPCLEYCPVTSDDFNTHLKAHLQTFSHSEVLGPTFHLGS